jgi:molybdenum cofactor synthesis domain-containing protein
MLNTVVLTISDKCSQGGREDKSGKIVQDMLDKNIYKIAKYEIIPDETDQIKEKLIGYADDLKVSLVLTTGGTGFSPRDITPEATKQVIEREVPGIPEAMRAEGFKKTKKAMLSRGVAGIRGNTLIINLPGSSRGAGESLGTIIDELPHAFKMLAGGGH